MACTLPSALGQSTGQPVRGEVTVDVEPAEFRLKAPTNATMRFWVNATIVCEAGTEPPRVMVYANDSAAGPDDSYYKMTPSALNVAASPDPATPNGFKLQRVIDAWINSTTAPPEDFDRKVSWMIHGVGGLMVPPSCSTRGYGWDVKRAESFRVFVEGRYHGQTPPPGPDEPAFYVRGQANETEAERGPATFDGYSRVPAEAAFMMAGAVAVIGLLSLRWFGRR